jgi:RNA polymerase sigma factor (sigma-70 family)
LTNLQTILRGCIANEARCQRLLYERYYGYAFKIAFRYIYSYRRVPDVVNDSFVKLFRNLGLFKGLESGEAEPRLMGWIKKIVVHTAIDDLRRSKVKLETDTIMEQVWEETSDSDNADNLIRYKELICHIKSLSPSYRTVFNMHVIDGYSHREIASQMGISEAASKSNLYKAKACLQKLIQSEVMHSIA